MASVHKVLSDRFYRWEKRGRGWQVFDHPVSPEPPFVPFAHQFVAPTAPIDDGRRPTFLSSIVRNISQQLSTEPPPPPVIEEVEEEPEPAILIRDSLVELQTSLPAKLDVSKDVLEQFLLNLSLCREPIAFELVGASNRVTAQFATHPSDAALVRRQLQAYFPEATFQTRENTLEQVWDTCSGEEDLVVEFGLAREFTFPLASGKPDPFIGIVGALSELHQNELGLFQVLFQPAHHPWAESIIRSVAYDDGKPFFVNNPELTQAAKNKVDRPLYAAVARIAVRSQLFERTVQIASDLAGSLRVFAHPQGNELIPLDNSDYRFDEHIEDVVRRQSRRSGMLLNSDELIGFVHLPSSAVRSPVFERQIGKTRPAPRIVGQQGLLLGKNEHAGKTVEVRLSAEQRVRHCHLIGASGTGKSTLLWNLISQDIQNGEGIAVLDPHGDLIDRILRSIPQNRIDDVVLVDPSDEQYSVGFNILSAHSDLEKNLLASDLVSVFQRLSTSWGDQMGSVLSNAILAFLESSKGGTLADLRRFLLEPAYRAEFLKTVHDPELIYYWQKGFPQLSGNKSIGPVLTRLETFLSPKPIRYMVSQRENKLDFANIMDSGKIFLAKLSQGLLGKENSHLLGTLLISKFQQLAMSRQAQEARQRKPFIIYADEFHHFITPSMAEILTGARKYRVGLVLAHQELRQLERDREVASAVSACHSRIVFRVGDDDARKLAEGFASFDARDLQNLETGQAICRVERSDYDFNLSVPCADEPDEAQAAKRRAEVITASRNKYARARADIEAALKSAVAVTTKPESVIKPQPIAPPASPAPPKVSQTPKSTVSEKEEQVVGKVEPFRDLGRGGAQHKAIQERIQKEAHELGFQAIVEGQLAGASNEAADLVLRKGNLTIAVEISVTTTIDHEFGNVKKCLAAGFNQVAVVSHRPEHLKAIAESVKAGLGAEQAANVGYYSLDEFIAELQNLAQAAPPNLENTTRGYKVRGRAPTLTPEERNAKEEAAIRIMAEMMKRKR